jgi:short-subunit dehydrogenase
MRDLREGSVVITGASSGIGRATAYAFARRGARLVLCARGAEALEEAVGDCRRLGTFAIGVPTDVRDQAAVERLARTAAETFGGIDVWVNNAGGGVVGQFWDVPIEAHKATVELDLMGYLYGAHAALPYFLKQDRGVLINNVSIGGLMPTPLASSYAAAKAGVRAFSRSLGLELHDRPGIDVCAVFPPFVDAPGIQHAANYTGRTVKPGPFAIAPERVADVIVGLVHRPRSEVVVGLTGKLAHLQHQLAPGLTEASFARGAKALLARASQAPVGDGNLFEPTQGPMTVDGGWRRGGSAARSSAYVAAAGLAAGTCLALLVRRAKS